jgi:hypothetical protein
MTESPWTDSDSPAYVGDIFVKNFSKTLVDNVFAVDITSLADASTSTDPFAISDTLTKNLSVIFYDILYLNDLFTTGNVLSQGEVNTGAVNDTIHFYGEFHTTGDNQLYSSDILTKAISFNLLETLSCVDTFLVSLGVIKSDGVASLELVYKSFDKYINDNCTSTDVFSKAFFRSPTDTAYSSDILNKNITQIKVETSWALDIPSKQINKTLLDNLSISDAFLGELSGAGLTSNREDQGSVGDVLHIEGNLYTTGDNQLILADSGLINKQNYVDAGYFGEDYAGTNYNF